MARGELEKGMSPMAVLLAWGEPEQVVGEPGGGRFRGRDSGLGTGIGVTMPLGSRPPVSCNVLFEDGKVIGWEAVNGF